MEKRRCNVDDCKKNAAPGKKKCWAHVKSKYRADNPVKSAYQNLRTSSKKRGKEFSLTFEEFEQFCVESEYIKGKGIFVNSLHVDRIDETKGYVTGNIQVLPNGKNVKKYCDFAYRDQSGVHFTARRKTEENDEFCPY